MSLPNGMIDFTCDKINIHEHIFNIAKNIFLTRGSIQLDTPVAELFDNVNNLYGEEFNKSVYTLDSNDENKQKLFLRYDLTVPLARYVGMNGLRNFRRHQIGKVYRKDNAQIQKGRYREFYQCDFDIVGTDNNTFAYDLEMIDTINSLLEKLLGTNMFKIKLNHKNIVLEMLTKSNVPIELHNTICSSLDKLDKKSWTDIQTELEQKLLDNKSINTIKMYYDKFSMCNSNNEITYKMLVEENLLEGNTLNNINIIMEFLKSTNCNHFVLDPFLIRGMDYYTGILFEALYIDNSIIESTILAGGRYDNMIEKFSNIDKVPAIGMSIGVERISLILNNKYTSKNPKYQVYIASLGNINYVETMKICSDLRNENIVTCMSHMNNQSMRQHFNTVFKENIPIMIIFGENEYKNNTVTIKNITTKQQCSVSKTEYVDIIKKILSENEK